MKIEEIIWKPFIVEKNERKHDVSTTEVEEILHGRKKVRKISRGNVKGEDVYVALGQTMAGRYLTVFFILKRNRSVLPISARDMDAKEKKRYKHGK